jgi:hypothetical protein
MSWRMLIGRGVWKGRVAGAQMCEDAGQSETRTFLRLSTCNLFPGENSSNPTTRSHGVPGDEGDVRIACHTMLLGHVSG